MSATNYFQSFSSIPSNLSFDAILVLGGGVPEDITNPPTYTKERCNAASKIYHQKSNDSPPKILTLSAGTAHLPQALSADGLPIWESTSSAAYLIQTLNVKPEDIYAETTSYDTISNAFFARLNFCDLAPWKKLLIITNEFHMERTKLIFDWIFQAPLSTSSSSSSKDTYELYYYAVPDVGLSQKAIEARKEKEAKSAKTVQTILSQKYTTIEEIFRFLTEDHSFYTASKLVERGMDDGSKSIGSLVQDSYGGISIHKKKNRVGSNGHSIGGLSGENSLRVSFLFGTLFGVAVMFLITKSRGRGKSHLP